jgi:hypothetical protein
MIEASFRPATCCVFLFAPCPSELLADEVLRKEEAAAAAAASSAPPAASLPGGAPRSLQMHAGGQAYNSYAAMLRQRQQSLAAHGAGRQDSGASSPGDTRGAGAVAPGSAQDAVPSLTPP